jgi:WD40 repeat protein
LASETDHPQNIEEETVTYGGVVPSQIGEYQLVRQIGGGGMGVVYEALHTRLKRRVALKVISEPQSEKPSAWRRFFREMEVFGKLEHPHVVRATDAGEFNGVPYLVMEFVDGADLSRVVRQHGPLPPLAALDVMQQTAEALGHIHSHGLVHRDIKPSNLLLDKWGVVKVADLGLAQLQDPEPDTQEITTMGAIVGTVDYMSPEQADFPHPIDHRADIYSLGCCLYFLLCGEPVFKAPSRLDRLLAHRIEAAPELPPSRGIRMPDCLSRLFHEMLEKNPDLRPQSIGAVVDRLEACREPLQASIRGARQVEPLSVGGQRLAPDAGIADVARAVFAREIKGTGVPSGTTRLQSVKRRRLPTAKWLLGVAAVVAVAGLLAVPRLFAPGELGTIEGGGAPDAGQEKQVIAAAPEAREFPAILRGHKDAVFCTRFSHAGSKILSASGDGSVRVWDVASKRQDQLLAGHDNLVINVVFIPETELAAAACYDGCVYVWNWHSGELLRRPKLHSSRTESVAWVKGTQVISSGLNDVLLIWDVMSGDVVARLHNTHQGGVRALAVAPDGRHAVAGDYEGNISYWNLDEQQFLGWLSVGNSPVKVWCLDWSATADLIAIGGIYTNQAPLLVTYAPAAGRIEQKFEGHTWRVNAVRFSRDGKRLYAAGDNVRIWSLADPQQSFQFSDHTGEVFGLDESPDGRLLVSGGGDSTVRISTIPPEP